MRQPSHLPVGRICKRLAFLITRSGHSQRDLEQKLGFKRGHLSQILGGDIELKLWHVEALLDELEIDPGDFFAELFPHPRHLPWGIDLEHEAELAARGKLLPLLLGALYGFGIEALEAEHRRLELLEDRLVDLKREQGEDVTP